MHQFEWFSERGGNFLNLLQKEGVLRKEGFPRKKRGGGGGGGVPSLEVPTLKSEERKGKT